MRPKTTIYDASGSDRTSLRAWGVMWRELRDYHEVIYRLVASNISGQFRQSYIGYMWIALPPIATTLVFSVLRQANIVNVPMAAGAMPYALFALLGTTLWGFFSSVALSATGSIGGAGALVSKVYFPREVLVLTSVGQNLATILVRVGVLLLSLLVFRYAPPWQALFAPLFLLPLLLLGLGMGMFLAPLHTVMPDIGRIVGFIFQFGMFMAPTIYPTPKISAVTSDWQLGLYLLHSMNPVTHFMHAITDLMQDGAVQWDAGLMGSMGFSVVLFLVGWRFFHVCEPYLAERV